MKYFGKRILILVVLFMPFWAISQGNVVDSLPELKVWDFGGTASLTLTQTGQVNWVQGGEPSISYIGNVELFATYNKNKQSWENLGKFTYGQQSQGYSRDFRISDDRIDISTKYGYKVSNTTFVTALASFKSKFAAGYEYPDAGERYQVSEFLSPAYIAAAVGMDYKPNSTTSVFVSPISTKTTLVLDTLIDGTKYGLDSSETIRNEFGAFIKATNKTTIVKNVDMENRLELFSSYTNNPQNIDVLWEFKLVMSVNKYLKTVFSTTLIYDDDIAIPKDINDASIGNTKAIQFKEMLSVGFLLNF